MCYTMPYCHLRGDSDALCLELVTLVAEVALNLRMDMRDGRIQENVILVVLIGVCVCICV